MGKIQITTLLVFAWVILSTSVAQQTSNASYSRTNGLGSHLALPAQLRSAYARRNPVPSSIIRTQPTDNQSATAEHSQQQTEGEGSPDGTPQLQPASGFGSQQQFPSYAKPGPPYFGFNFGTPSVYPQQQPAPAGQPGPAQTTPQIQPKGTPFYPNGFPVFNYHTTADFLNRFNPTPQAGNVDTSKTSSPSASSETGHTPGNATPSAQAQNFGGNFGGSFPFSAGFGQNFPQNPFQPPTFGTVGQGTPITANSPDDGSQKPVVGFYGNVAPNIGSYSFTGSPGQEQPFQTQFQSSFQPTDFGQSAGFGQFPTGSGFDGFGQFGFGPSGGFTGQDLGNGVSPDHQSTQQPQQILG